MPEIVYDMKLMVAVFVEANEKPDDIEEAVVNALAENDLIAGPENVKRISLESYELEER